MLGVYREETSTWRYSVLACLQGARRPPVTDDRGARPMTIQTSLQLFTIREQLEADLEGTLAAVPARGFTAVEPYDFVRRAEPLAASLAANGLTAPTGHAFLASESFVLPDGSGTTVPVPSHDEVFAAAKTLGMSTVIDPYTAPDRWNTVEQIEQTARLLN